MGTDTKTLETLANREYKWGFVTEIDADAAPKGLNEDIIRLISTKKNEPEFMLEWRLKAYRYWSKLEKEQAEPKWASGPDRGQRRRRYRPGDRTVTNGRHA